LNNIIQPLFQYLVAWILLEVPLEHGNDSLNARTSFFDFDYSITSRSGPPPEYGFESFVQASKFRFGFIYSDSKNPTNVVDGLLFPIASKW